MLNYFQTIDHLSNIIVRFYLYRIMHNFFIRQSNGMTVVDLSDLFVMLE